MARANQLTLRIAYNLFTQKPTQELADFQRWTALVTPGQGSDMYRANGAGEMLVYTAADFEDFRAPRPDMPPSMEADLERVVRHLAQARWPFRLHATYDETIGRALDVFEKVHAEAPLTDLHWFFDHGETIPPRNIDRVKALADDRMNAVAFGKAMPLGARINAIYSSDIGHFDVVDMRDPLPEAFELVEDGHITESDFQDVVFGNAVRLWGTQNPRFFEGTAVAKEAAALLKRGAPTPRDAAR